MQIKQINGLLNYQIGLSNGGRPSEIYWVVNDACNMECKFCNFWKGIYHESGREILSLEQIKKLLLRFSGLKIPYILFTGGEPFLRNDMLDILEYAAKQISHIRVQTNGTLITKDISEEIVREELLDELWFSLDGKSATHDKLRGVSGTFLKVTDALENINYFKLKYNRIYPRLIIHAAVNEANVEELPDILSSCVKNKIGEWFLSYTTNVSDEKITGTKVILNMEGFYSGQMKSQKSLSPNGIKLGEDILKQISDAKREGLTVFVDPLLKTGQGNDVFCFGSWL